jgi:hypothetical protein
MIARTSKGTVRRTDAPADAHPISRDCRCKCLPVHLPRVGDVEEPQGPPVALHGSGDGH